jgi:ketosteroid isomerase-like protein
MAAESRTALAKKFMEVFASRDADAILARMTDDPTWVFWGRPRQGRDGVLSILKAASQLYRPDSMSRSYQGAYEDGDVAILQSTLCATTFKGEDYENRYVMFVHFEGDRVSKVEEYLDTAYANEKFSGWEE